MPTTEGSEDASTAAAAGTTVGHVPARARASGSTGPVPTRPGQVPGQHSSTNSMESAGTTRSAAEANTNQEPITTRHEGRANTPTQE